MNQGVRVQRHKLGPRVQRLSHLSSMAMATVASSSANWSPTHLRMPPPKGMKAKSAATSLGYSELPCASGLTADKANTRQGLASSGASVGVVTIEWFTSPCTMVVGADTIACCADMTSQSRIGSARKQHAQPSRLQRHFLRKGTDPHLYPAHAPSKAALVYVSEKRVGSNASGSRHRCGDRCRFQTLMKMSAPCMERQFLRDFFGHGHRLGAVTGNGQTQEHTVS